MSKQIRRQKLVADKELQGALVARTTMYWFYCLLSVALFAECWIIFTHQPTSSVELFGRLWMNCGPALLGSILLLPVVQWDCLSLSNRFVGPMVRIRQATKELAQGQTPQPIELRDGDFWSELADDFNLVIARCAATAPPAPTFVQEASARADAPVAVIPEQAAATGAATKANSAALPAPVTGPISVLDLYSDLSV